MRGSGGRRESRFALGAHRHVKQAGRGGLCVPHAPFLVKLPEKSKNTKSKSRRSGRIYTKLTWCSTEFQASRANFDMASIPPMTGTRLPAEEHMLMLPIEPTIKARSRPYTPSSHLAGLSVTTDNVLSQAPKFFLPPSASEAEDEGLDMISPCACADDHDGSFTSTRAPFGRSISLCDGSFTSTSGPLDRSISLCDVDSQGTVEPFFPEAKRRRSSSYTGAARGPGKVLCFNGPEVAKDKTRSDSGFSESPTPDCQDGPNEVFDKSKTEDPYDEVWLKRLPGFEFTLDESAPLPSPKPTFKSTPASGVQRPVPRHLSPMETVSAPGAVTPAREFNRNLSLESLTSPSPTPLSRRGSARRRSARQASPDAEAVAARLPEKQAGKKRTAWDRMNTISSMDVSMMPVDDGIISGLNVRGDGLAKCGLPVTMTKHRKHDLIRLITPTTLVGLMEGRFSHKFDHYLIVDSRFPFEHQGGHIQGMVLPRVVTAWLSLHLQAVRISGPWRRPWLLC